MRPVCRVPASNIVGIPYCTYKGPSAPCAVGTLGVWECVCVYVGGGEVGKVLACGNVLAISQTIAFPLVSAARIF